MQEGIQGIAKNFTFFNCCDIQGLCIKRSSHLGVFCEKAAWKISKPSQKNTCNGDTFSTGAVGFYSSKKGSIAGVF